MNFKHPQALNGFLLSGMSSYPKAIGLPGWMIDVLREEHARGPGDGLTVAYAMLRPEYLREWSVKRMRLIEGEELQGYLDPILLYIDQSGRRERAGFELNTLPEFQRLAPDEQAAALRFVTSTPAPGADLAPDGWMRKLFGDLRKQPLSPAYLQGAITSTDTFCLHFAFVRSFLA